MSRGAQILGLIIIPFVLGKGLRPHERLFYGKAKRDRASVQKAILLHWRILFYCVVVEDAMSVSEGQDINDTQVLD